MNFTTNLKQILLDNNMDNYAYLGRQLSFSRQTMWNYAEGNRLPSREDRVNIVAFINTKTGKVYTEADIWPSFRSSKGRYHG
jgi:hypothetical protein